MGNIFSEPILTTNENRKTVMFYSDDEQYIGECAGEVREGVGIYTYANGDKYEGAWHGNVKEGRGYFYYNNGELYIGEWLKNKKHGQGMYFYQTGDRFDGMWEHNMKEGRGKYYYIDGSVFEGLFRNSKKHQIGTTHQRDGSIYEETWDDGQLVSKKQTKKPDHSPIVAPRKVVRNFKKQHSKPKMCRDELTFSAHIDVTQYMNEKLLNKNISEWKTSDVGDWLDRGGFSQYKENFVKNHITGKNIFDLTEDDLEHELNIKDSNHKKRIFKDMKFLKKVYSKNPDEVEYVRNKLLRFYEKNQGELFAKNHGTMIQEPVNLGGVLLDPAQIASEITIHNKELKDVNDRKDALDATTLNRRAQSSSSSSSGSESSSSSENDEQEEAFEKRAPMKKGRTVIKKPVEKSEEASIHMSEYRTILHKYKQNDYDLLQTLQKTLGQMCVVDHSEIETGQSIGEGGYGEVFKGKWLGQDVAIKVYGRKKVRNKDQIDSDFLREVEVISKLRHPNIVLFMGVSINPQGKGLLLTEYLLGGSLFDHLHKKGTKFTDNQMISIALDIALGMNYLHGQNILHCDLKSSNILLDEHFHIKLADFGLSKSKRKLHGRKSFKRVGTPHWMAPEIMREEEYDEASDVYSYGMILWELVVKKVPYFGLKINQIVGSVGYGDKQVPIPETGNEIINVLMRKCLERQRTERPSFKAIADYLKDTDKHRKLIAMRELDNFFN